jgi:hypothetical protein
MHPSQSATGPRAGRYSRAEATRGAVRRARRVLAGLALATLAVAGALPAAAQGDSPWKVVPKSKGIFRPVMPDPRLDPPANVTPVLIAYGQGVQRYVCKEKDDAKGTFAWVLKEPVAKLFDDQDKEIGTHFAGPTWALADGSKVVKKKVVASAPALQVDGVPWLLVEVEASGAGRLAGVRFVQRVDTVGGAAPAAGCDAAHAAATLDVDYRAVYVFYAGAGGAS